MELTNYGITLRRLTEDKIEMVRQWRNDPKIQQYMEFRDYITPEMQAAWFKRIDNDNNYYFIIVYEGKEIGLANIKDIDYNSGIGEPGMFIYEDIYWDSDVAIRALLCMNDFMWHTLKLKKSIIHVMQNNIRAIKFNLFLGYKLDAGQENVMNQLYTLTYEESQSNQKLNNIRKILIKQHNYEIK